MPDTETLDKLYLEWSQFTRAKTEREVDAEFAIQACIRRIEYLHEIHPESASDDCTIEVAKKVLAKIQR